MIFCEHCFNISEMIAIVHSIPDVEEKECPVCHSKVSHFYDTDENDGLTPYFESLLDIYIPAQHLSSKYPQAEKRSIVDDIKYRWKIFSSNVQDKDQLKILQAICPGRTALFSGEVGIPELYDHEYLEGHSLIRNGRWDNFVEDIKTKNRYHPNLVNFEILEKYFLQIKKTYREGNSFYRARISPTREGFVRQDMSAPPAGKSLEGRANARGITCLYLADNIETALREVRASLFDFVTVGEFKLKQDISVVNFRDIMQIPPSFEDSELLRDYAVNMQFLEKINTEMGKSLRRSDSTLDYVPTQYIADFIKSRGKYDGIEYNSTTYPEGYNLAIFDPELFECVSSDVYEITSIDYNYTKVSSKTTQEKIMKLLKEDENISVEAIAKQMGISVGTIRKYLKKFFDEGIIRRVGPDKGGHWEIIEK